MKYRIKEVYKLVGEKKLFPDGSISEYEYDSTKRFYPQYKEFLFWHYFFEKRIIDTYDTVCFFDEESAKEFLLKKKISDFDHKNHKEKKVVNIIKFEE